jgi:hypothetical protein
MLNVVMLSVIHAECRRKPIMLSVVNFGVVTLNVVAPSFNMDDRFCLYLTFSLGIQLILTKILRLKKHHGASTTHC